MGEISGDHTVEVVTDAMLDKLISQFNHVVVLFYDKEDEESASILEALVTKSASCCCNLSQLQKSPF